MEYFFDLLVCVKPNAQQTEVGSRCVVIADVVDRHRGASTLQDYNITYLVLGLCRLHLLLLLHWFHGKFHQA